MALPYIPWTPPDTSRPADIIRAVIQQQEQRRQFDALRAEAAQKQLQDSAADLRTARAKDLQDALKLAEGESRIKENEAQARFYDAQTGEYSPENSGPLRPSDTLRGVPTIPQLPVPGDNRAGDTEPTFDAASLPFGTDETHPNIVPETSGASVGNAANFDPGGMLLPPVDFQPTRQNIAADLRAKPGAGVVLPPEIPKPDNRGLVRDAINQARREMEDTASHMPKRDANRLRREFELKAAGAQMTQGENPDDLPTWAHEKGFELNEDGKWIGVNKAVYDISIKSGKFSAVPAKPEQIEGLKPVPGKPGDFTLGKSLYRDTPQGTFRVGVAPAAVQALADADGEIWQRRKDGKWIDQNGDVHDEAPSGVTRLPGKFDEQRLHATQDANAAKTTYQSVQQAQDAYKAAEREAKEATDGLGEISKQNLVQGLPPNGTTPESWTQFANQQKRIEDARKAQQDALKAWNELRSKIGPQGDSAPKPTTKEEFDALAPGTVYVGKDGRKYRKP